MGWWVRQVDSDPLSQQEQSKEQPWDLKISMREQDDVYFPECRESPSSDEHEQIIEMHYGSSEVLSLYDRDLRCVLSYPSEGVSASDLLIRSVVARRTPMHTYVYASTL